MATESSTLHPLLPLGKLSPGRGVSAKDLDSALHDITQAADAGQPAFSLFAGVQRDMATSDAVRRFPTGLRTMVAVRSSEARAIDPFADWTRALRPKISRGPFVNELGEEFWIDTFQIPTLTAIVVQNAFGQRTLLAGLPVRSQSLLTGRLRLGAGTIWLPARAFVPGRPAGEFVGVRVSGGAVIITGPVVADGTTLVVSGAWQVELRLTLDHAANPAAGAGPGADARNAQIEMPKTATITLAASGLRSVALPNARATIYGSEVALSRTADPPFYDTLTKAIVVPFAPEPDSFDFADVQSGVWSIQGASRIRRSGWALTVSSPDLNALGEADNAGALWLDLDRPLRLTWANQPVAARAPRTVVSASPGSLMVWSTIAAHDVTQPLSLWNESGHETPRRSSLEIASAAGSVVLNVSLPDLDAIVFGGTVTAHLDRPLAADGGRLGIQIANGWFTAVETPAGRFGSVLANDTTASAAPHIAFALENAFIKARPPAWLSASGPLTADGLDSGRALLRCAFRFVLPTLPDPYASSFSIPKQDADIGWVTVATTWDSPADVSLAFTIVPAGDGGLANGFAITNTIAFARQGATPVLLDVSSNADQFGVAIPLRAGTTSSLQIAGMALVAEARHVAVMTLPPISWEPMLTKTPEPGAAGDVPLPPPPHDGGPAILSAETVELRPVAPIPLLTTYHDAIRRHQHFNARLPLPFGLIANIDTHGPGGDAPASTFDGTVFFNVPEFDGTLAGGRQLAILGAPGVAGARDPTISGYLTAESTNDYAKGVLSDNVLTGVLSDFGSGEGGIPVRRYELSGYGASLFSDWRDPEAEGPAIIQARFDVITGRTSHEVIQLQSALDPCHARVVRTITIDRQPGGWVLREDSGWVPTSDGRFTFKGDSKAVGTSVPPAFIPDNVHTGAVEAVVNIRNIRLNGATFTLPTSGGTITWQPVLYDADILFVDSANPRLTIAEGSTARRVPSRNLTGWIQINGPKYNSMSKTGALVPRTRPASGKDIADLLTTYGPAMGAIDARLLLGGTAAQPGLNFRAVRMDVSPADPGGTPRLVAAVRGSPQLPRDGAWSVARLGTGDTAPKALDASFPVPLVRPNSATTGRERWHLADPADILQLADAASPAMRYGLVQSMGTQKVFFERPRVGNDAKPVTLPKPPKLADVGALLNAAGIFPGLGDAFDFNVFDGFDVSSGQLGFTKTFPILKGGARTSAVLADLGGSDSIQLVIDYEDEKQQATVATITVNPVASPRWSLSLERVAFTVRFRGADLIRLFAKVKADEHHAPAVDDINVRYEGVLSALQTIFTNVQQVARYLPGGAGANLRVAFSQGHLTIQNGFSLPNLPLGAGQITDIAVIMGLDVALSPFDLRFIAGLGSSAQPFRWIVSPLAGTGVVQVGISANGLDVLVQCGLGLGLAIDLGIASGSASVALALEINTGPDPFEIKVIISGRASVDVLMGLASATITLAAGVGIIPPKELLKPPFLPPSIPPPAEIPSFTIGFTASVAVGIHLTVCWVVDVDFDGYWQFRQDVTTPAIPIPSPF